jgi:hypothetical protein
VDGCGGQLSLGGESHEGAVGAHIFVCVSTGSTDVKLRASHEQFPVALAQLLARVEAEHFKNHHTCVDAHSVNLSKDAEEVCAVHQTVIVPVSAGTPQEMPFTEPRVRVVKRVGAAMMQGAPHLLADAWACCD